MPIHDWTRVDSGLFHAFHHGWIEELARALNRGVLPSDYFALPEQNIRGSIPDVLTLKLGTVVIDLFPPGKRDPQGIHKAIWDQFDEQDLKLPDKPLTLASYDAGPDYVAYVEFVGVGDELPDMPLFLKPETYVPTPLETTYQAAWSAFPDALKHLLDRTP